MPVSAASARRTSATRSSSASQFGGARSAYRSAPTSIDSASTPTRPNAVSGRRTASRRRCSYAARAYASIRRLLPVGQERSAERDGADRREQRPRKRRHEREREDQGRRDAQDVRSREQLRGEVDAQRAVARDTRHHEPHRRRDQEGGERGEQRVADRQDRERLDRVERRHPVIQRADDHAAEQVQRDDDERRDGVAFDELARAVHRRVEIGLALDARALAARDVGIEQAGVQIRVDRHLLAGHRVEREACAHFRDALRAARDHHELNRDQDREHDESDDDVAAHDELSERGDQRADGARIVTVGEDQPGRADVEREPEQRREQQRRGERRELQRLFDAQADEQHQRGTEDVEREQHVEQRRRQRHDQDRDDAQHRDGEGAGEPVLHVRTPSRASDAMICATAT